MTSFEDTKLLRHPTVEAAYAEMRKFFIDGEDFAAQAVRAGEIITANAKNPDPDAIAASVLMDGMIITYTASSFATTVSPRAAEILQNMYDFDPDNPVFKSPAEQQIVLAHSIMGLDDIAAKIKSGEVYSGLSFRELKNALDKNEKVLLKLIEGPDESGMAVAAVEKLLVTKTALDDFVRRAQAELTFEKSGLPNHPLVREVYEYMRDENYEMHPLGGYTDTNTAIAKLIWDARASTDPEVICAALLNQYSTHDGKKHPGEFSPRIGELWEETSAWARHGTDKDAKSTDEGRMIRQAAHIHFAERTLEGLVDSRRKGEELSFYGLEHLEDIKAYVDADLKKGADEVLRPLMERVAREADRFMNEPANVAVRKPGSPRQDPGW